MRAVGRSPLDEWLEEGLEFGAGVIGSPFGTSIVALDDLRHETPEEVRFKGQLPTASRFSAILRRLGAQSLLRTSLGTVPNFVRPPQGDKAQARLYSLRDHDRYAAMSPEELVEAYWAERATIPPRSP